VARRCIELGDRWFDDVLATFRLTPLKRGGDDEKILRNMELFVSMNSFQCLCLCGTENAVIMSSHQSHCLVVYGEKVQ